MGWVGRQSAGKIDREVRRNIIGKEEKRRSIKEKEVGGDFSVFENLLNCLAVNC